jgi:desulfoferrodoxin-like iron-binding protein
LAELKKKLKNQRNEWNNGIVECWAKPKKYLGFLKKPIIPIFQYLEGQMPNKVGQVYVGEICGNKVEMIVAGKGTLHCCGQPMKLVEEKK